MQAKTMVVALVIAGISSLAQADICPDISKIKKTNQGFEAVDESGRKWEGEDPGQPVDVKTLIFENAAYITETKPKTGQWKSNR
jgi:hypothetical protein